MKKRISAAVFAVISAVLMSGCATDKTSESINIFDVSGITLSESDVPAQNVQTQSGTGSSQYIPKFTYTDDLTSSDILDTSDNTSDLESTQSESSGTEQTYDNGSDTAPAESTEDTQSATESTESTQSTGMIGIPVEGSTDRDTSDISTGDTDTTGSDIATEPTSVGTDYPGITQSSYTALNHSDVKGIWISYIELSEMLTGKTREQFAQNIADAFDKISETGINTVYVHVRSHGDAYYNSELFPWSKYVTGEIGKAPDYDPLEIMINQAHSRGLSLHAWINPLRVCKTLEISSYSGFPIGDWASDTNTKGKYIAAVGDQYYLNPAYDEVINLIARGAAEIVENYSVDGLHIDDYFYPTTDISFDEAAYKESGYGTVSAFRFANCDKMVAGIFDAVNSASTTALFSVSCQGSVDNNYNLLYADVKKWCADGFLDYIVPQIYYGFTNSTQPYEDCLAQWDTIARSGGIPLVVGLSAYKIGTRDVWAGAGENEWLTDKNILKRQTLCARECVSYGGISLYSFRSVFAPDSGVKAMVDDEIAALKPLLE